MNAEQIMTAIKTRGVKPDWPDPRRWTLSVDETPPHEVENLPYAWGRWDQGAEGSCVGLGGESVIETIREAIGLKRIRISARGIYDPSRVIDAIPGDYLEGEGTTLAAAAEIVRRFVIPHNLLPYEPNEQVILDPECWFQLFLAGTQYRMLSTHSIADATLSLGAQTELIKYAIWKGYAVLMGLFISDAWLDPPSSGLINESGVKGIGGHAIAFVGYSDATGRYTVVNSWGREWGNNGCCLLRYEDVFRRLISGYLLTPRQR